MDHECILICATGRSGSTTLQRILNTIPDTNICGENENAIIHLLNFYKSAKKTHKIGNAKYSYFLKHNKKPCWYNNFDLADIKQSIKQMIFKFLNEKAGCKIFGFKEIRYNKENLPLLLLFKELFPKTKIIIHIRKDVESQSKSDWWALNPKSLEILTNGNLLLTNFFEEKDEHDKYLSTFEDLFDMNQLRKLFVFLQKEDSFNEIEIKKILDNNQN